MDRQLSRYERRLLVDIFEDIAAESPERVFAAIANGNDVKDGFTDITFEQVARGTDFVCQFLRESLGPSPAYEFETLTYIGIADLRYTMFLLACIKCSYKAFYPSPRNTDEVNSSLMDQTRSTKIFHSQEMSALATRLCLASVIERTAIEMLPLRDILTGNAEHVSYSVPFEDGLQHPMLVLHSSGSTGMPKPVTMRLGFAAVHGTCRSFKTPTGRTSADFTINDFGGKGGRSFAPFPPSHLGGLIVWVLSPIYSLSIPVCAPPLRIPSAELFLEVMERQDLRAATLPPSLVESLVRLPGGLDSLKKLDWLAFAGGPLSRSVGSIVSKYTMLCQFYGSTETAAMNQLIPLPEDWEYMEFHPDESYRMEHVCNDIYELVFLADPRASEHYAGAAAFTYTVGGSEYSSRDLFRKHPHKDLWQFHGRKDDIVVLSSTEKFFPIPTETSLCGNAAIAAALVFGEGHIRPGVLIEPSVAFRQRSDLVDQVWSAVQQANLAAPGFGQISKAMIIFSNPDKPFVRTLKGTVIRKLTLAHYESDISALYSKVDNRSDQAAGASPESISIGVLRRLTRSVVCEVLAGLSFEDTTNLYILGMDSLNTADVISRLSDQLGREDWLTPNLCYTNPSVAALAAAISERLKGASTGERTDRVSQIKAAISEFSYRPTAPRDSFSKELDRKDTNTRSESICSVTVTGATGTLGTELVRSLLEVHARCSIICLNRRPDLRKHWKQTSEQSVTEYIVDYSKRYLGLSAAQIKAIQACDAIIHSAWKVDFNQDLSSFEDNLVGLQNLIALCIAAKRRFLPVVYISSVSAAGSSPVVPEAAIEDLSASSEMGYGQSKLVAEHILARAALEYGLPVVILRVGQIAGSSGPRKTAWSKKEAFPALFRTSKQLELTPDDLAPVNWIPIDHAARAIHELSSARLNDRSLANPAYYNLVNPHETNWRDLIGPLQHHCGLASKVAPLNEWVEALSAFDQTDKEQLESLPALKVLDFFKFMARNVHQNVIFETEKAVMDSPTMASLEAISKELLGGWLKAID